MSQTTRKSNSDFLTEIIIGMSDGIIVPFALVMGLTAAHMGHPQLSIITGAAIVAGAIAMGFAGYRATKTEFVDYHNELKRKYDTLSTQPVVRPGETKEFFSNIGLSEDMQAIALGEIAKDEQQWIEFIKKYELGMENADAGTAIRSGFTIGISYVLGGLIPLLPYFFIGDLSDALFTSIGLTTVALIFFGYFKGRINNVSPAGAVLRVTITGLLTGTAAFIIGRVISE